MPNIEPYHGGGGNLIPRPSRLGRELSRIDGAQQVRAARIEAEADVLATKVQAVGYVASKALQTAALVSQLEQQLAQTVPIATSRLEAIGNMAALAMNEVVADTPHLLRRV